MKRVLDIIRECNIANVLQQLISAAPAKDHSMILEKYYSLYCMILHSWFIDSEVEMIITGFRQIGLNLTTPEYAFYGTCEAYEIAVPWTMSLTGKINLLIPQPIIDLTDADSLTVLFLSQIRRNYSLPVEIRRNLPLFQSVRKKDLSRKLEMTALEKNFERQVYLMDKRCLKNTLLEYRETKMPIIKWPELFNEVTTLNPELIKLHKVSSPTVKRMIYRFDLPPVFAKLYSLDKENPPDLIRCSEGIERLKDAYKNITLSDYQYTIDKHMRIIIEYNPSLRRLPMIYVRDKYGTKMELYSVELSKLLCMDIYVTSKGLPQDPGYILSLLIYYLEFPIRVERRQKQALIQMLTGMLYAKANTIT